MVLASICCGRIPPGRQLNKPSKVWTSLLDSTPTQTTSPRLRNSCSNGRHLVSPSLLHQGLLTSCQQVAMMPVLPRQRGRQRLIGNAAMRSSGKSLLALPNGKRCQPVCSSVLGWWTPAKRGKFSQSMPSRPLPHKIQLGASVACRGRSSRAKSSREPSPMRTYC
jgi:hypothetical protein